MMRPPSYSQLLREIAVRNKEARPYFNTKNTDRQSNSLNKKAMSSNTTFEELKFTSKAKEVKQY